MKKVLIVLLLLLLVMAAGLVVFVVTFDVNRFKPMIISQIETAVGNPVRLERLSLGWDGGIALELAGLGIYSDEKAEGEPAITVDRASALLSLKQLFKRQISIGSIVIDGLHLHILRSGDGTVHVLGFNPGKPAAPASSPPSQTGGLAAVPILISTIRLNDGLLRFTDSLISPPSELVIRDLDIIVDQVSLDKPIRAEARMALFSRRQNVSATGHFRIPSGKNPGLLENVRVEVDLQEIDPEELTRAAAGLAGLRLEGELAADLGQMTFDSNGIRELSAEIQLKDGKAALPQLNDSIERISAVASVSKNRLEFRQLSAYFAGGSVEASGAVDQLMSTGLLNLQGTLKNFELESFQAETQREAPRLEGKLNGSFNISSAGLTGPQMSQSLAGQVNADVSEPVIVNFNLVREVFARLAILPRLVDTLEKRLPEDYGEKLKQKDTILNPIHVQGRIEGGRLTLDNLLLASDTFELSGRITAGFDGSISGSTVLRLDPDLSLAIIRSVTELQHLTDREGRLEIPVYIRNDRGQLAAVPDLQYIATKLAVVKTQEVLGKWLEKKTGGPSEKSGEEPAQETTSKGDLVGSLIGGLLQDRT